MMMAVKITFTLPAEVVNGADGGILLGDFNGWNTENALQLKMTSDGSLQGSAMLEPGHTYQYRYRLNDGRWVNDGNAQYYAHVEGLHIENCVIVVPEATTQQTAAKPVAKKAPAKPAGMIIDDFSHIAGINKNVAALLLKNDINTYSKLSKASVKNLKKILAAGGSKFAKVNPSSWPKEGRIASTAKLERAKLQEEPIK